MKELKSRKKDILEYIRPYFEERFYKSCEEIEAFCMENAIEFCEGCLVPFEKIFKKAQILQLEEVETVYISFLRSSILSDSCQFRIELYNKKFWLNEDSLLQYFDMPLIFDFMEKDIKFFKVLIDKKFIRLSAHEMQTVQLEYAEYYFSLLLQIFKDFSDHILSLSDLIKKTDNFEILYGEHMGKCVKIFPYGQ